MAGASCAHIGCRHRPGLAYSNVYSVLLSMSTRDQLPIAATMSSLRSSVSLQVRGTRGRRLTGVLSWSPPGMLIMASGHDGKPIDFDELERWTRIGDERGMRFRKGER